MTKPELNIAPVGSRIVPEFFQIPPRGGDPHFGVSRSSYYDLEKRGLLRLVRLRKPGNVRGRVLVPYAETAALIRRLSEKESAA
jgi:hypothetical protein